MSLVPFDRSASGAIVVSDYLSAARDWLATAVEMTGPEQIAAAKAEIATAAEATKQLGLSREIQLDAQEMVRRAEYALGKAIRKGQAEGVIRTQGEKGTKGNQHISGVPVNNMKSSPTDFATEWELSGNGAGIYDLADAPDPADFDAAISEAKAEGNLSRANVARKIKGCDRPSPLSARLDEIRGLVEQGATRSQIAKALGVGEKHVSDTCARHDITITADVVRGGARRFNHMRVLDNVTESLEVAAMSLRDVDPARLDKEDALERVDSLTASINALSKAVKKIKESFHE